MLIVAPKSGDARESRRRLAFGWTVSVWLTFASAAWGQDFDARYEFHIEEETLGEALRDFVRETHVLVLYPYELADTTGMNPVVGHYTIGEAFDILLRGSGLSGGLTKSGVLTISRNNAIEAEGREEEAMSKRGSKKSLLARVIALMFGSGAHAQDVTQVAPENTVVVVGSSIRGGATSDTNANPIQFVTDGDFRMTKGDFVTEFLEVLPIVTGNQQTALNSEYQGGETGVNLRGVGLAYTLTLLEGTRMNGGDNADIGAIPPLALDGIEILKTGASAIYGSDAVAGVINLRLKKNYQGFELRSSYGQSTRGDAQNYLIGALFGVVEDRYSLTGSLSYQGREGFTKYDRERTATRDYRALGGLDRRSQTFGEPQQIVFNDARILTLDPTRFGPGDYTGNPADYVPYNHETQAIGTNELDTYPPFERVSGHWAAQYDIRDDGRASFFTYGYADQRRQRWQRRVGTASANVPASNPYNPFGEDVVVNYNFGDFGSEIGNYLTTNWTGVAGLKGVLSNDIDYELSYTSHHKKLHAANENYIALDWFQDAVNRTDALAFNPFGYYANSPEQSELVRAPTWNFDNRDSVKLVNAKIDGSLFDWHAGNVAFAVGYQFRDQTYRRTTDYATTEIRKDDGESPFVESRNIHAYYGEFRIPLYNAPGASFITSAEVTAAARREIYNDFGGVTVWQTAGKIGLFDESLLLRASYSDSFRAPTIQALFSPQQTMFQTQKNLYDPVRGGVFPFYETTGGNPDLKPERGESLNIGAVFRPKFTSNLFASVDFWTLKIQDLIALPSLEDLFNGVSLIGSISRDPITQVVTADIRYSNGGSFKLSGIDVAIRYTVPTDRLGTFGFGINATETFEFDEIGTDGVTVVQRLDTDTNPKLRAVLNVDWQYGNFDAAAFLRHRAGWQEFTLPRRVDDYQTVDVQAGYNLDRFNGRIYVGVENLLDAHLPFVSDQADGWARSLDDYRGRYLYFGVTKSF